MAQFYTRLLSNATVDSVGVAMQNGTTGIAVYAVTLKGLLGKAVCDILVDVEGGSNWVQAGSLSDGHSAKLIMLPRNARLTARLSGAEAGVTDITVDIAS